MSDSNTDQLKRQAEEFQRSQRARRERDAQEQREREKNRYEAAVKTAAKGAVKGPVKGKDSGCFPAGTLITTAQGDLNIAAVREGDFVTTLDSHGQVVKGRRVVRVLKHCRCRIWRIRFADGQFVRTTAIHCFLVGANWVQARYLREGHLVSTVSPLGEVILRRVSRSIGDDELEDVYNLIVEDDFTFLAEGFVVHSFTRFRSFRTCFWKVRLALTSCWHALSESLAASRTVLRNAYSLHGDTLPPV
jgi:hypothetical protein